MLSPLTNNFHIHLCAVWIHGCMFTVRAAYMGRLGTGYSCLLYPLSLISVKSLTGPGDGNMRANLALSHTRFPLGGFHCIVNLFKVLTKVCRIGLSRIDLWGIKFDHFQPEVYI